jgi:hypothetical protein
MTHNTSTTMFFQVIAQIAISKDDEMQSHILYNWLQHFKLEHISFPAGHGVQVKYVSRRYGKGANWLRLTRALVSFVSSLVTQACSWFGFQDTTLNIRMGCMSILDKQCNSCSRWSSYNFTCTNTNISVITATNSINSLNSTISRHRHGYI